MPLEFWDSRFGADDHNSANRLEFVRCLTYSVWSLTNLEGAMLADSGRTVEFRTDEGVRDQPERTFAEHDDEVNRPLAREIPREIEERPVPLPSEPSRQAWTNGDDQLPR